MEKALQQIIDEEHDEKEELIKVLRAKIKDNQDRFQCEQPPTKDIDEPRSHSDCLQKDSDVALKSGTLN